VLIVFLVPAVVAVFAWRRTTRYGLIYPAMLLLSLIPLGSQPVIFQQRDFFGVHQVVSVTDAGGTSHRLIDGGIIHGFQMMDPERRHVPSAYYSRTGPVGDLFSAMEPVSANWNVAVVGLGAGSIACYARPQQTWTYYEIDPVVVQIALDRSLFSLVPDCTPGAQIVLGDGRLTIAKAADQSYDLIILDAFGSDSVPVHLITREAIQLYLAKLRPGGVLLFNISNKYVDVGTVLARAAASLSLASYQRIDSDVTAAEEAAGKFPSAWVVMAPEAANLGDIPHRPAWRSPHADPSKPVWTDDFSNVLSVTQLR
jgi:hypothetical protein